MCLQEAVEVVPDSRYPVDDLHQLHVARSAADLRLDQLPPQVATEEAFHRLHVVGTQHPPDQRTHGRMKTLNRKHHTDFPPRFRDEIYCKSFNMSNIRVGGGHRQQFT